MSVALVKHDERQMSPQISQDKILFELDQTQELCQKLMRTPHYSKMGEVGIYAIVNKAKSMGVNPLDALNGSFYFVQGKVEMSGQSMLALIRSHGHSVSLNERSTNTHVVMDGKRCDNGDTWTVEFSIDDAKRAGIYRGQWEKYPKVMCMWRCVSMLGRFLFSDILKGVYVQGEISEAPAFDAPVEFSNNLEKEVVSISNTISKEQADELQAIIDQCSDSYKEVVKKFLKKNKINSLYDLPMETYVKMKEAAIKKRDEYVKEQEYLHEQSLSEEEIIEVVEE